MSGVQLLEIGGTEQEVFTRWDISGHQVSRHLLDKALTGTEGVVLDHLPFPPGSPVEVLPGNALVIPRGNWHQISNVGTVDSPVLHFLAGVGSVDDIGYGAYEGQVEATGSLRNWQGSSACG